VATMGYGFFWRVTWETQVLLEGHIVYCSNTEAAEAARGENYLDITPVLVRVQCPRFLSVVRPGSSIYVGLSKIGRGETEIRG